MLGSMVKKERLAQNMSQQSLAEGICAISYLSKIENELVICSEDIYSQLMDRLDIEYVINNEQLSAFQTAYDEWEHNVLHHNSLDVKYYSTSLFEQANQCVHSTVAVKALLYIGYSKYIYDQDLTDTIQLLISLEKHFNETQNLMFANLQSLDLNRQNKFGESVCILKRYLSFDHNGLLKGQLAMSYYFLGQYHQAIEVAREVLQIAANHARIYAQYEMMSLLAFSYSNLHDIPNMLRYFDYLEQFNHYIDNEEVHFRIYYNLGASFFCLGKHEKAKEYLEKANQLGIEEEMLFQKLAFVYCALGEYELAQEMASKIKDSNRAILQASYILLCTMIEDKYYIKTEIYRKQLEECITIARQEQHFGITQFFSELLLEYYIANRQYQKALHLNREFNIS